MLLIVGSFLFTAACSNAQQAEAYVCPPCGQDCDKLHFSKAGECLHCGMTLVKKNKKKKTVAILLFDSVQIIDYTGPYEIFGQAGYKVYTVSKTGKMVNTVFGMKVTPTYSFANAPQPDILVIPGGDTRTIRKDQTTIDWVNKAYKKADRTMSVCTGAFVLAEAKLLDNKTVTTFHYALARLAKNYPKVKVVTDKRFVSDGKILTSAGLSAGMDGALAMVAEEQGLGRAQQIALNIEYIWQPEKKYARGEFADFKYLRGTRRLVRKLKHTDKITFTNTKGNTTYWNAHWNIQTKEANKVWSQITTHYDKQYKLAKQKYKANWSFKGTDNKDWKGEVTLQAVSGTKSDYQLVVKVWQKGNLQK